MDAIEFVKKFGWKEAKVCLLNCAMQQDKWFMRRGELISGHDFDDLKQIVWAFELVKKHGGLNNAKYDAQYLFADWDYRSPMERRLKQAIELVEKCNASD